MKTKTILCVLLDRFADWEAAFLTSSLRNGVLPGCTGSYQVSYASPGGSAVSSMGGLMGIPNRDIESGLPKDCAGIILVGGMSWRSPKAQKVVPLVETAIQRGILIGAICDACTFLAAHGFLNDIRHTGNSVEILSEYGGERYTGAELFQNDPAVRDGLIVTASGTCYMEFTRECLLALNADTPENIAASYEFFKNWTAQ